MIFFHFDILEILKRALTTLRLRVCLLWFNGVNAERVTPTMVVMSPAGTCLSTDGKIPTTLQIFLTSSISKCHGHHHHHHTTFQNFNFGGDAAPSTTDAASLLVK